MIRGLSGTLLSADALLSAGLGVAEEENAVAVWRQLGRVQAAIDRVAGPAWTARQVFDEVISPICAALGFRVLPAASGRSAVTAMLLANDGVVAVALAVPWGEDPSAAWRQGVLSGIGAGVRWCLCFNGPVLRIFDAARTHTRRYVELELSAVASDPATFGVAWHILNAGSFSSRASGLDRAVTISERHRLEVRDSLQTGVHEALGRLTSAFLDADKLRPPHRGPALSPALALEEALVVIYRILFLLFAEARGLVPNWHPVFRESYTVEAIRAAIETQTRPRGVWATLQAIARLAHHGCRAGTLRVPPFNGRLFSPAHAPLADSCPLDDTRVREAMVSLTTRQERGARRRIAYADLGVEHLGGVYERVLDFDLSTGDAGATVLVRSGRRKATGTFYTPRTLTEYLVRRTLAPLAERASPAEILNLKIVDPAMGSGAFLVAACRYLAHMYETALVREGAVAAVDVSEGERASFRRVVAQRCLYGVDLNPMAVQLARLSLWLATLCADRPLTFFDDQLRIGNSVAGASLGDVTRAVAGGRRSAPLPLFDAGDADQVIAAAVRSHAALREGPEETLDQIRGKERLLASLTGRDADLTRCKRIVDLWCAGWFVGGRRIARPVFQALVDATTLPGPVAGRLLRSAEEVAGRERFFHWPLEFPDVFCEDSGHPRIEGGFDAVLGNPPWEMLRGDAGTTSSRETRAEAGSRLTRFTRESGVYRFQGDGHANLYQLFLERALSIVRPRGRLGLILPSGFAIDHGCARLRRHVLDSTAIDSLVGVENADGIFPIHRGMKFMLMTTTRGGRSTALPLRCGLRKAAEFEALGDSGNDPSAVVLSRDLLERMSGEQLAIPDIRSKADAALAARLTLGHPPASDVEAGWGLRFGRELNATDDKRYFASTGAMAVVEGKQVEPFAVHVHRSRQFIARATAARLLPALSYDRPRLTYRDVAAATNRLTLIAAILPAGVVTTHTLFCLKTRLDDDAQHYLCAIFNSYVANYLVRMRVTTHVTVSIIGRLPVPRPPRETEEFRALVALSRALSGETRDTDTAARHQALAARIYGLQAEEFAQVLETFPLVPKGLRDAAMEAFIRTL